MEDTEIIELLYLHDEEGLIKTKDKYDKILNNLSYGILKNKSDSEECINDTYLKLWKTIPPYKPSFLKSFLCKITRQLSIDKYRYNHRQNRDNNCNVSLSEFDYEICSKNNVEDELSEKLLTEEINEYISNLDVESQVIFVRRYFLFEDIKSISKRFNINENYIKVKLFRMRNNLKKQLEKRGYLLEKN